MTEPGDPPQAAKHYVMGDVGAGARVVQGDRNTWIESRVSGLPGGEELQSRFTALIERLEADPDLDEDERELAVDKTAAVVDALAAAPEEPGRLKRALLDAKGFLGGAVGWAWAELQDIVTSDAAQMTIGTITEAGARAAIAAVIGR